MSLSAQLAPDPLSPADIAMAALLALEGAEVDVQCLRKTKVGLQGSSLIWFLMLIDSSRILFLPKISQCKCASVQPKPQMTNVEAETQHSSL